MINIKYFQNQFLETSQPSNIDIYLQVGFLRSFFFFFSVSYQRNKKHDI